MAKKKRGGFGRFLGALTGTPYERLLKQVEKLSSEHADDERKLGKALKKLVDVVGTAYEEEEIDEDDHKNRHCGNGINHRKQRGKTSK